MTTSSTHRKRQARGRRGDAVPRVGAFFDMDKTLIAENSGSIVMKHRYQSGEIDGWDLAKGIGIYLQYKVGLLDIESWAREAVREYAGQREEDLEVEGEAIFREQILGTIYPEAAKLVQHHLESGHVVAIVSGATRFVVEPLARHLGVEHCLYTRLEVERGRLTGRAVEPVCFEEGKIYWLQQFIEEHQIDLALSYFYTDSITDLPLLDLVGHPSVTNPDPMLYRAAVRRGWPVQLFSPPPRKQEQEREQEFEPD